MKEAYCSYEVSRLLKKKGFDEPCRSYFTDNVDYIDSSYSTEELTDLNMGVWDTLRPTHQMACAWLREVHKVLIVIDAYHADHWEGYIDSFEIRIYSHASTIIVPNEIAHHTDYTEAVEAALKYSLENLL